MGIGIWIGDHNMERTAHMCSTHSCFVWVLYIDIGAGIGMCIGLGIGLDIYVCNLHAYWHRYL